MSLPACCLGTPVRAAVLALCIGSSAALAGSISAPGFMAGPDSGPATADPAAAHFNPAALGGTTGFQTLLDAQVAFIRVDVEHTRTADVYPNSCVQEDYTGIDPNTCEPYKTSTGRAKVPVAMLGFSHKPTKWLAYGLAITDAFVGGGDYSSTEPDMEAPYEGPQRYAGVKTKILTLHAVPAVAITPVEGLHAGAGLKVIYDSFAAIQASDPLGSEGVSTNADDPPYSGDSVLDGEGSGLHIGWNAGLFVDRWKFAQVGLAWHHNGAFSVEGEATLDTPEVVGGGAPKADFTFDGPLPDVLMFWFNSQVTDSLKLGAGLEHQMWNRCCGGEEGDYIIGLTSKDGDALGVDPEDGISITVDEQQYSPRRLWNSTNFGANAGWQHEKLWLGGRTQYAQNAVPDYAVSATNLDFQSVGFQVAARYQVSKPVTVGLSYSKFFTFDREITEEESAWDRRQGDPAGWDPRFTPQTPFKAGAAGKYQSKVDVVGVRVATRF
jgi:long-subunit fatty acid transport protein